MKKPKMDRKRIDELFEKAKQLYRKRVDNLYKKCDHDFERYSDYGGTDYTCRKCGYTK